MLSVAHVSLSMAQDYYKVLAEQELSDTLSPQARYYAQDKTGLWIGKGAAMWGLAGESVTEEEFTNVLAGRSPDGTTQLIQAGQDQKHRAAYDMTFSSPKSVSILAEILEPELRQKLYEAHTSSVLKAIRYFEANFAEARITKDYLTERVQTDNIIAAVFLENSTRNTLDPQIHSHAVLANATLRPDQKFRAISNEEIYNQRVLLGQIYQNEFAKQVQELGFGVRHKGKGLFELANMPEEVLVHFSARHEQIEAKLPELRRLYPTLNENALRDLAAKWTRDKKVKLSQEELHELWEAKFKELGYDKKKLLKMARSKQYEQRQNLNHTEIALSVLTESSSVVKKQEILKLAMQYSLGEKTIDDIEAEFEQAQSSVELAPGLYSTQPVIEREHRLAQGIAASKGQQTPIVTRRREILLPKELQLSDEQSATLLQILNTRDSTNLLEGDAGSGKSTLLKTVVQNYSKAGFDIKALSPSALAAAGLRDKGIHNANTVASHLTKIQSTNPRRQLVIVDEASLLGSKDLTAIYDHIKSGDQVLLVGDAKQHQTLSGGGFFDKLQKLHLVESSRLKENLRQREAAPAIAESVRLLAERQSGKAFELLDKHNRLQEIADDDERFNAIVDKYLQKSFTQDTLIITQSNLERDKLNEMVRQRLIEAGHVAAKGLKITTNQMKNLRGEERNFAFGYVTSDHFYISEPVAGFRRGSQGEILDIDHLQNTITAKMKGFGKTKTVTIDLKSEGHFLSTYETSDKEFAVGDSINFTKTHRQMGIENGRRGTVTALKADGTMTVITDERREIMFNTKEYSYLTHSWAITSFKSQGIDTDTVLFSADTRQGLNYNSAYVACSRAKEDILIYTNSKEEFLNRSQEQEIKPTTLEYTWPEQKHTHGLALELGQFPD